jgi:3-phenylpropionate/trans-cinnamate dioxygenase ferredoxin subunit
VLGEEFVYVANSDELPEGLPVQRIVENETILLARVNGQIRAVSGICTHAYSELVDGELDGTHLYCSLHFACFDICTGAVLQGPADKPLRVYDVVESDGGIFIRCDWRAKHA